VSDSEKNLDLINRLIQRYEEENASTTTKLLLKYWNTRCLIPLYTKRNYLQRKIGSVDNGSV
jgi:hypothetical protein